MLKKMEALYSDLAEFYVFDQAKYTLEDFFGDIKVFKDSFNVSVILLFSYLFQSVWFSKIINLRFRMRIWKT